MCYPSAKAGIISIDLVAHLPGCKIRKKLQTGQFTINTSVAPRKICDDCSLGIAIGAEDV